MKSRHWSLTARYFAFVLVLLFVIFFGWQIRLLLRSLLVAGLIAYILYPLILLLQRQVHLNRRVASNIVYFFSLALMNTRRACRPLVWLASSVISSRMWPFSSTTSPSRNAANSCARMNAISFRRSARSPGDNPGFEER